MPKHSNSQQSISQPVQPKRSLRLAFKLAYVFLAMVTAAALATPPAMAANIIVDDIVAPIIMIASVAILMSVLVIEIWRQTGKNTAPALKRQMLSARKKRKNH